MYQALLRDPPKSANHLKRWAALPSVCALKACPQAPQLVQLSKRSTLSVVSSESISLSGSGQPEAEECWMSLRSGAWAELGPSHVFGDRRFQRCLPAPAKAVSLKPQWMF